MSRSLYAQSHKGARAMLAALVERAGRTDFVDPIEVAALRSAMRAAFDALERRAQLEDRVIGPLLRAHAPASAVEVASAHAEHRSRMQRLVASLSEAEWRRDGAPHALVVAISRLAADLASHFADDEELVMPALASALSPDALAAAARALDHASSADERLAWLRWTIPAATASERVAMLRALRASRAVYEDAVAIALASLDEGAARRLEIALGLAAAA